MDFNLCVLVNNFNYNNLFQGLDMSQIIPTGKTKVICVGQTHQSQILKGDTGYIDGYVQAADNRPYGIFVRFSDGVMDFVNAHDILADLN